MWYGDTLYPFVLASNKLTHPKDGLGLHGLYSGRNFIFKTVMKVLG